MFLQNCFNCTKQRSLLMYLNNLIFSFHLALELLLNNAKMFVLSLADTILIVYFKKRWKVNYYKSMIDICKYRTVWKNIFMLLSLIWYDDDIFHFIIIVIIQKEKLDYYI